MDARTKLTKLLVELLGGEDRLPPKSDARMEISETDASGILRLLKSGDAVVVSRGVAEKIIQELSDGRRK